ASDRQIVERLRLMSQQERFSLISGLASSLTQEEVNILLGRRQGLQEYEEHMRTGDWCEADWQDFFERHQWVFGYGLDYRVMRQFDREMTVGAGGTDNRNKPIVDFLMTFKDYTVLVEIKKPDTPIFKSPRGGRAGTWEFSPEFMSSISQVLEQKAEWLAFAQSGEHLDKSGTMLEARTRNARTILVIGSSEEFLRAGNTRDTRIMTDTFELLRRETRSIDIVTFDVLLERARFIIRSE
ncbi:MAG: Shedu immune nuclease family protein, partial [Gimesia chilikensis]